MNPTAKLDAADLAPAPADEPPRHPFLVALGERVRTLRSRRGMTRKAVALAADVSERHLANLEYGTGNASVLVLLQVAQALQCSLTELLGDVTTSSPEWLLIRELLEHRNEADLRRARVAIGSLLGGGAAAGGDAGRSARIALIGLRGAGKSTLLQLLTGLFTPDQGRIEVLGHDMRAQPARALAGLGVVFQQSALDMDLSVMANLLFHTDLHGMPRALARERIGTQLAAMGLQDQARAVVRNLSGGTRRKVELVRALLHAPRVLLMDEATVGLDPASRQQLLDSVRRLCREQGLAGLACEDREGTCRDHDEVVRAAAPACR